jgi:succinyl-diaminopimelate desuccinylase
MPDQVSAALDAWLAQRESQLIEDYREMLRIPSIEGPAEPNAPFGRANRDALDLALRQAEGWGMRTKDLEGYAGWAEFGSGEKLIMILGHLDVVPVGPGWKHEPFGAEIADGYVYARGATDDKGPTMAAFYAAKAVMDVCPDLNARVRLVFGCDEESGFKCIERYNQSEEAPTYGIAPDAMWPCVHAEKGICTVEVSSPVGTGDFALLELNGGQRPNIVIDSASARVRVAASVRSHVESKLADAWDRNLTATWSGDELHIEAIGKAAHGSWPFGGDNAAIRILRFLMEIAPLGDQQAMSELFELTDPCGSGLGVAGSDEPSGHLTCNLGIVQTADGEIRFTLNLRYPVTWKGDDIRTRIECFLAARPIPLRVAEFTDSPSLYFPVDHPLVRAVVDVYAEETGERLKPQTMGGGTYARAVANSVAIGTGWLGDGEAHQTDERCAIASIHRMARIYAKIIHRLALS